ncbi:TonB-dependent receptor [uncultured Maricaulis sp.]|uniref:TonB-dependent receptor plug domain-containing protein n=1 Tax=uncultured Maricaulis sp. TaxID=174710 RepID=UPI0030D6FC95|tara:strand:+ start:34207 stop:36228 length:2022 start_codon:yes stop_codon:yes gene_type:complete
MKTTTLLTTISAIALSAAFTVGVSAQQLDYTSMSEMFGEAVTAGATGAPQRASDVPATMIIITQDEIERFPEYDIPGILRHYGGVDVTRYAYGDGQVSVRGAATGYTPRLLVLVNGREVYLDSYGYTAWSTLPVQLDEIQQIEVVKGPQSALYGFNAVAGVVNIITRNPNHGDYTQLRVNAGTDEYQGISFTAARQLGDRFAVRASYGASEANEFTPYAGQATAVLRAPGEPDFSRETGAIEGRFRITDKVNLTAEATFSNVRASEGDSIYYHENTGYTLVSYKGDLEADTDWGFLTLSAYRNESEIEYSFGAQDVTLTTLRLQDLFRVGTNDTIRLSLEFRQGETGSFPDPTNGDFGYETTAFSAMWNHKFSNAVDLTLAGRFDSVDWSRDAQPNPFLYPFAQADYDVSIEELSYNAALVWRPEFGGAVRLTAARGVQAPTMFDIGFTMPVNLGGFFVVAAGNPAIEPSIVTNYEIAYDRALTPTMTLRAAVFLQETEGVKSQLGQAPDLLPPATPVPTFLFDNRGDTQVAGVELTLAGRPDNAWSWDANYTYKQVEDDMSLFPFYTPLNFEEATPSHIANAHLGWTDGRFTIDGYANYVSAINMPNQPVFGTITLDPIDSYIALSMRAGYEINDHFTVAVNAQNANFGSGEVTNTHHQTESRVWVSLSAGF